MKRTKTTSITTETREIHLVRRRTAARTVSRCDDCRKTTWWLDLNDAVRQSGVSIREIFRMLEAGTVHSIETGGEFAPICQNCLQDHLR